MTKERINVQFPLPLLRQVRAEAKRSGETVATIIRRAVYQYVAGQQPHTTEKAS